MLQFPQVTNYKTYDDAYDSDDQELIAVYIRYDFRYDIYSRQTYSILVLLGDIGGLQQSLYLLGMIIVSFLSRRIFVSSILRHIYQVKQEISKEPVEIRSVKASSVKIKPNIGPEISLSTKNNM